MQALPRRFDGSFDVLVVGGGAAGFAAAITAASRGARVALLEKAPQAGGTTARSGGGSWVPNNAHMRARGITDPREWALRYMARLSFPGRYDPAGPTLGLPADRYRAIATYFDRGAGAFEDLTRLGVAFEIGGDPAGDPLGPPDYYAELDEDRAPRGRSLSPAGQEQGASLVAEDGGGAALIRAYAAVSSRLGVTTLLEHRVVALFGDDRGGVSGLEASTPAGPVALGAARGVVFASGGFNKNTALRRRYLHGPVYGGCSVPTNTGDLLPLALDAGVALGGMQHAWWGQLPLEPALADPDQANMVWLPYGDSMLQVNRFGRRVLNEKQVYNERAQAHFAFDADGLEFVNRVTFMVYDRDVADDPHFEAFRWPLPAPGQTAPHVVSGSTLQALAVGIAERLRGLESETGGLRLDAGFADTLTATVARFNAFAAAGRDLDFGRGDRGIEAAWGASVRGLGSPNPTMHPLRTEGPYHCVLLGAGCLDTKGGPQIDEHARMLTDDGRPVAGLYGAGNCVESATGQAYWAAGSTLGPAQTFGHIAGAHAAAHG